MSNRVRIRHDLACAVFAVGASEARSPATGSSSYAGLPVSFATRIGPVKFIPYNRTENVSFAPLSARELLFNTYYLYWAPLPGTAQLQNEYVRPQYPELEGCWTAMGGEAGRPPVGCNRVQLSSASFLFGRVPKVEITELETNAQNGNCLVGIEQGLSFDALGPPEEKPQPNGQCIAKYRKTATPAKKTAPPPIARPSPAQVARALAALAAPVPTKAAPALPPRKKKSNWVGKYDPESKFPYWDNTVTGESTWDKPPDASNWIEYFDTESKYPYWENSVTHEQSIVKPGDA